MKLRSRWQNIRWVWQNVHPDWERVTISGLQNCCCFCPCCGALPGRLLALSFAMKLLSRTTSGHLFNLKCSDLLTSQMDCKKKKTSNCSGWCSSRSKPLGPPPHRLHLSRPQQPHHHLPLPLLFPPALNNNSNPLMIMDNMQQMYMSKQKKYKISE